MKKKKAAAKKKKAKKAAAKKKKEEKLEEKRLLFLKFCESKLSIVLGRNEKDLKNKKLSDHMQKKCLEAMQQQKHSLYKLFNWFAQESSEEISPVGTE